jgi:antitoxin (DNA-binding transcriptional repressor) of toxin-antitoxin stability system
VTCGTDARRARAATPRWTPFASKTLISASIVILTTSGHTVTMGTVTVAELKARLSHYLREVRAGRTFTVLSRDVPVALLGPWESGAEDDLVIIPADPRAPSLFEPMFGPSGLPVDGAELIRRDREASDARMDAVFREESRGTKGESGEEQH